MGMLSNLPGKKKATPEERALYKQLALMLIEQVGMDHLDEMERSLDELHNDAVIAHAQGVRDYEDLKAAIRQRLEQESAPNN